MYRRSEVALRAIFCSLINLNSRQIYQVYASTCTVMSDAVGSPIYLHYFAHSLSLCSALEVNEIFIWTQNGAYFAVYRLRVQYVSP